MRLTTSFNSTVKNFVSSGAPSMLWTIKPGKPQKQAFQSHDLPMTPFSLRLVRVLLPSGQVEVLVTNLLDEERWPSVEFSALYHRRWRIEETFRHIKARLKLEQFGGETPLAIRQEFHATILLHNLETLAAMDALAQHPGGETENFTANLTHASHLIRQHLPQLLCEPETCAALYQLLLERMATMITRRRLGRKGTPRDPEREKPHPNRAYK